MNAPSSVKKYVEAHLLRMKFSRSGKYTAPFSEFIAYCEDNDYCLVENGLIDYPIHTIKFCILNDFPPPKCDCGAITGWSTSESGQFYQTCCSMACRSKSKRYTGILSKKKKELYSDSTWKDEVESKKSSTLLKNYNVKHPMQSTELFLKQQSSCFKKDENGLHGYEPFIYPLLLTLYPDVILGTDYLSDQNMKIQWYDDKNKLHSFYPDFYSNELNSFIEIKGDYTREKHEYKLRKCRQALNALNFGYIILTCTPNKSIKIECFNREYINE